MEAADNKTLTIEIQIDESPQKTLTINYNETTDGVPIYEFEIKGSRIQIRKDNKWKLLWGELSQKSVEQIGRAIEGDL